jgi:hypothetical protein
MTGEELFTNLEADYEERLAKRATLWQVKHPEEAKRLRAEIDAHFEREPEPGGLLWQAREAAIVEAIRAKKGWPTLREYVRLQAGQEPAPPTYVPPKLKAVTTERVDHKARSAGE